MEKRSQIGYGTRIGAGIGALGGGALALALSYYNGKRKKRSIRERFIKGALWTALGALGGAAAGAGIGRAIGMHVRYRRNIEGAKADVANMKKKPARMFAVDFSSNSAKPADYFGEDSVMSKIAPKEIRIGHGSILLMDEDGGNATFIHGMPINKREREARAAAMMEEGKKENNPSKIRQAESMMSEERPHLEIYEERFGDALKGKSDEEIARFVADYSERKGMGSTADLREADRLVDRNFVYAFAKRANLSYNDTDTRSGYGVFPSWGENCATAARELYDASAGYGWSHFKDFLMFGTPRENMPSSGKKALNGKSYKLENREDTAPRRGEIIVMNVPEGWHRFMKNGG